MLLSLISFMMARPLSNLSEYQLSMKINEFHTALNYARWIAIHSGCNVQVKASNNVDSNGDNQQLSVSLFFTEQRCFENNDAYVFDPYQLAPYSLTLSSVYALVTDDKRPIDKVVIAPEKSHSFSIDFDKTGETCSKLNNEHQNTILLGKLNRVVHPSGNVLPITAQFNVDCNTGFVAKKRVNVS